MTMKTVDYAALVALDWGDREHAFALRVGEETETGQITASPEALHDWLQALGARCDGRAVALAIEGGRSAIMHALVDYPWLTIYPIHPATSERFRKAFTPSGAKDDLPDALVLLRVLAQHREQLRALRLDTAATRELAALNELRRGAVDHRTQLGCELRSTLKTMFPQALELCGDDLWTPLALDFLDRWPELAALQRAQPAALRAFYLAHNSRRPDVIARRLERIKAARPLTTDRAVLDPAILHVRLIVAVLRPLQAHLEQIEQRIADCFAAHPEAGFFAALPGAGPVLAPRLLTAFGTDRNRYPDAASLQKYSGVAPVREKSGRQIWTHWRWNAPKFLRQTFVEWAGQTVPKCAWAKAYYRQQERAGKRHQAILRALAFKWLRILWRCWHDHVPYDEARYLAALSQRKSPLATHLRTAA
jgi:transposase